MQKLKNFSVKALQGVTFFLEDLLAWGVLVALICYGGTLVWKYATHPALLATSMGMHTLLADALLLAMGAEFVRTFLQHTPETVVEVLTFAIARHMVIETGSMTEILAGCAAVLALILGQYYVSDKRAKKNLALAQLQAQSAPERAEAPETEPEMAHV